DSCHGDRWRADRHSHFSLSPTQDQPGRTMPNMAIGARPRELTITLRKRDRVTLATQEQPLVDMLGVQKSGSEREPFLEAHAERHEDAVVPPHRPLPLMGEIPHAHLGETR